MTPPRAVLLLVGFALGVGSVLVVTRPSTTPPVTTERSAADAAPAPARPTAHIRLSAAARALADIRSEVPPLASAPRERASFGRVIDGGKLRAAIRELQATSAALNAQHALTATLNKRRQALSGFAAQGELTVARELAQVELEYRREAATAQTQVGHLAALRAALRAQWGQTLAELATDDALFAPLATGAAQMIEFGAPAPPSGVWVDPAGERARARAVQVLGPAPTVLGATSLQTFFGLVRNDDLRIGMNLSVWLADGEVVHGVVLPPAALVWHNGAQWVFSEAAAGVFVRQRIDETIPHARGVLVPEGIKPGVAVVIRGAQTLLAEEFRQQIPAEDDD